MKRPDPTLGLDKAARTAICDASYGLLALVGGLYRRQLAPPPFEHAQGTIATLIDRGLLMRVGDGGGVQITYAGRRVASRIRARREAIAAWDRSRIHAAGYRASLERAHG